MAASKPKEGGREGGKTGTIDQKKALQGKKMRNDRKGWERGREGGKGRT
jgi:hypothetical protein